MTVVGIRALKQNASAVVAEVLAGESVTVTDRGRPVAAMIPLPTSPLGLLLASGQARPPRRSLHELLEPTQGPSLSNELAAMREAERY